MAVKDKSNASITSVYMAGVIGNDIQDVGIITNNFDFSCLMEENLLSAGEFEYLSDELLYVANHLGILMGKKKITMESFLPFISVSFDAHTNGTEKHSLDTSEESLKSIRVILAEADINDYQSVVTASKVLQLIGRYTQEVGIDSFKTFVLPTEVFSKDLLKDIRSAVKATRKSSIDWNNKLSIEKPLTKEEKRYREKKFFLESSLSSARDEMIESLISDLQESASRIQTLDKVREVLSQVYQYIPKESIEIINWIQADFMSLSRAHSHTANDIKKSLGNETLDKLSREMISNLFDPYYQGQRNLLRKLLSELGLKRDNVLGRVWAAYYAAIEKMDAKGSTPLDGEERSEIISSLLDKLLKEELAMTIFSDEDTAVAKLDFCTIPDGVEVEFKNHMATYEEYAAYGIQVSDGVYTIQETEKGFLATKNILAHLQEELNRQEQDGLITVRIKSIETYEWKEGHARTVPVSSSRILNHCANNTIILKDVAKRYGYSKEGKTGDSVYDAICLANGKAIAKFDFPFLDGLDVKVKAMLKKRVLEGEYEVVSSKSFRLYDKLPNGKDNFKSFHDKTFLLLSRKR